MQFIDVSEPYLFVISRRCEELYCRSSFINILSLYFCGLNSIELICFLFHQENKETLFQNTDTHSNKSLRNLLEFKIQPTNKTMLKWQGALVRVCSAYKIFYIIFFRYKYTVTSPENK